MHMRRPDDLPPVWLVRDAPPLNVYFRPARSDLRRLNELAAAGMSLGAGTVVDGIMLPKLRDLVDLREKSPEIILESHGIELATPVGFARLKDLKWAPRTRYSREPFTAKEIEGMCVSLASEAVAANVGAVIAPSSLLENTPLRNLAREAAGAKALRAALDEAGGSSVKIYFPLAAKLRLLAVPSARQKMIELLRPAVTDGAIDAVWIRAAGLEWRGALSNLRRYVAALRQFHVLGVPIVADRTGIFGVASMALGAVSGLSCGITSGERFDVRSLMSKPKGKPFRAAPRVFFPELGLLKSGKEAKQLLTNRTLKNWLVCQRSCCPQGSADMIGNPRRHFMTVRVEEVAELAAVPPTRRPMHFAGTINFMKERAKVAARTEPKLVATRERIDSLLAVYTAIMAEDSVLIPTVSPVEPGVKPAKPVLSLERTESRPGTMEL
jgi:hypothetical protein